MCGVEIGKIVLFHECPSGCPSFVLSTTYFCPNMFDEVCCADILLSFDLVTPLMFSWAALDGSLGTFGRGSRLLDSDLPVYLYLCLHSIWL